MNFCQRRFRFGGLFDERGSVTGLLNPAEVLAQRTVCLAQRYFTQCVELGFTTAHETEIPLVKKIELSAERRLGTARAFRDGGDAAEVRREPMNDEARLGERMSAEDDAGAALIHVIGGERGEVRGESRGRSAEPGISRP